MEFDDKKCEEYIDDLQIIINLIVWTKKKTGIQVISSNIQNTHKNSDYELWVKTKLQIISYIST